MPVLAIGGVELVALIIALAVILALIAAWVPFKILSIALGQFGWPIDQVAGAIESGINWAVHQVIRDFDFLTHGLAHLFYALGVGTWHIVYQLVQTIANAKSWAVSAYHTALAVGAAATAYTNSEIRALAGYTEGLIAEVNQTVAHDLAVAENFAAAEAATAEGYALGLADSVQNEAVRLFGQAEAAAVAGDQAAEAYALGLADSVQNEAVRLFTGAEAYAKSQADAVYNEAVRLFTDSETYAKDVAAAAEAAAIAGALAQVIPRVATLEAEATECTQPLCDNLKVQAPRLGHLGTLFQELETLGLEALLVALAAECLTNPAAVVEDISSVVSAVGDPVITEIRDLVGA